MLKSRLVVQTLLKVLYDLSVCLFLTLSPLTFAITFETKGCKNGDQIMQIKLVLLLKHL